MTNGSRNLAGIKIIHNHVDQSDEDDEDEIQEGGNILFVGIFLLLLLLLYWFRRAYLKHNAKLQDLGITNTDTTKHTNQENENNASLPDIEKQEAPTPVSENILSFATA